MSPEHGEQIAIDTHHTTVHKMGWPHEKAARRLCYMEKDGSCPMEFQQVSGEWGPYLTDIFTTLVEIRWRAMFLLFSLSYILSWLFFGLLYWVIAYVHKDTVEVDNEPCMHNVRDFTAAFLFSMETQATIGYGYRGMSETCMVAIILVTAQDLFSCLLDTIIIGIAAAKMASARKRAQTVCFSHCAVVNLRNGVLCLSWRLGDFRGNHILEGTVRAQLVRHVRQPSGVIFMSYQDLDIQGRDLVLATPATIIHRLEPGSPFYGLDPERLSEEDFDLVVSFTYTGDSTGLMHQTRTCYAPSDIRWGNCFQDMLKLGSKHYKVDYALFNQTTWVSVPMVSAEKYQRGRGRMGTHQSRDQVMAPIKTLKDVGETMTDVTVEVIQEAWL